MFTLMQESGLFGTLIGITILVTIFYTIVSLKLIFLSGGKNSLKTRETVQNILRTGIFSAVVGVSGTFHGGYSMIYEIRNASEISMKVVFMGIQMLFSSTVLGLSVFIITAFVWFVFLQIANYKYSEK